MFIIEKHEHKKMPYYFLRRAVQILVTYNSKYIAEKAKKIGNRGGREKLKKKCVGTMPKCMITRQ